MKKIMLLVVVALLLAAPAFAQGPFNDVPTDHWAYDAVNQLQKDGIVIGYPDGTFGGKRAMSRYEFAVAIARILPMVSKDVAGQPIDTSKFATKSDIANLATKADVDALNKLVNEFKDEIAALGVDVDTLKRDVAALGVRVDALEAEVKRVKITGNVNTFAVVTNGRSAATAFDLDQRTINPTDTIGRTVTMVKDFDLNIVGRVSDMTTANATINYGNYLNYLGFVDDYVGGSRPTSSAGTGGVAPNTLSDNFFPYYLYISTGLGKGELTVGRFPIQFTPYTLKKIDVDSYTAIFKTDDGNYPMDGVKLGVNLFGIDWTMFAAKNDTNDYLANGLTSQPTIPGFATMNDIGGHSVGGLNAPIAQTAGVRAKVGIPWQGTLGVTYYQAWSQAAYAAAAEYDQARVFGADFNVALGKNFGLGGSWTVSDPIARANAANIGDDTAWDAKINGGFGKLGFNIGYKDIDRNFAAAGFWDKIGRWANPTNIQGPYADVTYPISSSINLVANGEFLNVKDATSAGWTSDDKITKAEAGLKWGWSKSNSLDLGFQWVNYDFSVNPDAEESYLTVGWAHQLSANTGFKIGYQFINFDAGGAAVSLPYNTGDYRGGLGVVQFGVSF